VRVVGAEIGLASAVKMSTASVYKGTVALLAHALAAARANGVLDVVVEDLRGCTRSSSRSRARWSGGRSRSRRGTWTRCARSPRRRWTPG
jgi:3-hydroxyisobutyrate dehydrogenase-like beta-hydroxyacid dehydrogenase